MMNFLPQAKHYFRQILFQQNFIKTKLLLIILVNFLLTGCNFFTLQQHTLHQFLADHPRLFMLVRHCLPQTFFQEQHSMSDEEYRAHVTMAPDTLVSIEKGWMPYYHRHRKSYEINTVIQLLINKGRLTREKVYFFAILLAESSDQLDKLRQWAQLQPSGHQARVHELIRKIETLKKSGCSFPPKHKDIWTEYAISGDIESIRKYLRFLDPSQSLYDRNIKSAIEKNIYRYARCYYPVYELLQKESMAATGRYKKELEQISIKIYKTHYKYADEFWTLANNYKKNGEYSDALRAVRKGLFHAPDYPYLYKLAGNIFLKQHRLADAMLAYEYAKPTIDHTRMIDLLYQMSLVYYEQKQKNKIIEVYKESLALSPENVGTMIRLAWAYDFNGDLKNAELFYRKALQSNPGPDHVKYALAFFKRNHITAPCIKKPLGYLLLSKEFQKLETIFSESQKKRDMDENGRLAVYGMFDKIMPSASDPAELFISYIKIYDLWLRLHPDSYLANTAYGLLYIKYAWNARGCGYSNTVTSRGWDNFYDRLRTAKKYLLKAYSLSPDSIGAPAAMVKIANLLPEMTPEDVEKWFAIAVDIDPSDAEPYLHKARFMAPIWGGDAKRLLAFARDTAQKAPRDSMAPVILVKAHWSIAGDDIAHYFKNPEVWKEMKDTQEELLNRFPNSAERHNWFARSACLAEDFVTAKKELDIIGTNWISSIWANEEEFKGCKKKCLTIGENVP